MSVLVQNLTKVYGEQKAVDGVSFTARKGEVLGFLGPNGAGKTTTMKVLTTFIPPTGGKAAVCDFDVEENPMEVRRRIGYLPEHNPLYKELYVQEYLLFIAGLHGIRNKSQRVADMIAMRSPCWMPAAIRPLASERTSLRNCWEVTSCHWSPTRRRRATRLGLSVAWATILSVRPPVVISSNKGASDTSCMGAPVPGM